MALSRKGFISPLDRLADHECKRCSLNETTERVCVFGKGNPKSKLLILGEAPGAAEEESGVVFSGSAGKLLDQCLRESGLSTKDPYISNVVKCRPPDNRTPIQPEWEACRHYLRREIKAVNPDGVLLLGNIALRAVWGKSGITKHRGLPLEETRLSSELGLDGVKLMATFHPAYVLRVPAHGPTLAEDFKRFSRLIEGTLAAREVKVKYITSESSLRRVCRYLAKQPVISYDVENRHVPWMKDWKIVCLGMSADGDTTFVIPLWHPQSPLRKRWKRLLREYIPPVLSQGNRKLIAQNGKHDNLQLAGAQVFVEHTFDIMLAAHLLDENRPKNLGYLSQSILGADVYKGMVEVKPDKIMQQPIKDLCRYNGYDVGYTHQLYEPLRNELLKQPRLKRLFTKLMMPASSMMQRVEYRGFYVNRERLFDRMKILQGKIDDRLAVLAEHGFEGNPNSPQQLSRWLYGKEKNGGLGLSPVEYTATGNLSTREGVLLHYRDHPAIRALLRYRTLQLKWMNTYLLPWSTRLDERSRLHTTYKLYGTVTGRLSGDLQQVPRDPFVRSVIGAPPGWRFIQADYSQVELRIAAHCAHERRMIRAFNVGEDLHMATAMMLTRRPKELVSKEERKKAKAVNFGYLYGMYPKKFQTYAFEKYNLELTMAEAEESRRGYFKLFPDLLAWYDRVERVVRSRGYVQSPLGRVRHLPGVYSSDDGSVREAIRQAINSPVQATASDLMLFGMIQLHNILDERECFIVGTLHDGIFFECREDKVDKWTPVIKNTLENLPIRSTFGTELSVPIVADVDVETHWSEGLWQNYNEAEWITWA